MMIAIQQPHYFPWLGYLAKMAVVDKFMFMDTVQLEKRSYMIRNRIVDPDGQIRFLNISCDKRNHYQREYRELGIKDYKEWTERQKGILTRAYKKSLYFDEVWKAIAPIFDEEHESLCDVTIQSITIVKNLFQINTSLILQSDMEIDHNLKKGELILGLCKAAAADTYCAGRGASMQYLDVELFEKEGIQVVFQNYIHPVYEQIGDHSFVPGLSSLDLLFNKGIENSREIFWNSINRNGASIK